MLRINRIKARTNISLIVTIVILVTLICSGIYSIEAHAGGAGGTEWSGGSGGSGNCTSGFTWNGNGQHNCIGAAWMKFTVGTPAAGSSSSEQHIKDAAVLARIDDKCAAYGSYYRLGLARFHVSGGKFQYFTGELAYFKQVQHIAIDSVVGIGYAGDAKGALEWDEAQNAFNTAKKELAKESNPDKNTKDFLNQSWKETSWFCWDTSWESASEDAEFQSWSYASATADGQEIIPEFNTLEAADSEAERAAQTESEIVDVFFSHQMSYITPKDGDLAYEGEVYTTYDRTVYYDNNGSRDIISQATNQKLPVTEENFHYQGQAVDTGTDLWTDKGFRETHTEAQVSLGLGETKKICSTITYTKKYIKFNGEGNSVTFDDAASTGSGESTVCIILARGASVGPTGGSEFTSQSFAQTPDVHLENHTSMGMTGMSAIDGMLAIIKMGVSILNGSNKPSTAVSSIIGNAGFAFMEIEDATASFDFWHKMYYTPDSSFNFTSKDVVPDVSTNWDVVTRIKRFQVDNSNLSDDEMGWNVISKKKYTETGWSQLGSKIEGTWTLSGSAGEPKYKQTSGDLAKTSQSVTLEKGDYAFVCSTITYRPKYVKLKRSEDIDYDPALPHSDANHDYYKYVIDSESGLGSSEACVLIYRRIGITGTPTNGDEHNTLGTVVTDPMYVGEETTVGWYTEADSAAYFDSEVGWLGTILRRYQAVNCVVPANKNASSLPTLFSGSSSGSEPKGFYVGAGASVGCEAAYDSGPGLWGRGDNSHRANQVEHIVAPNEVGRKDCTGAGYYYEYWYKECNPITGKCWAKKGGEWWEDYGAVCRPTAKKPTVSVWNGGIFIGNGSIQTSIAKRYTDKKDIIYTLLADGGDPTYFGAWSEYLATVNGGIDNFTSGAVLATGLPGQSFNLMDNSPLTIQNTGGALGYSQIQSNSVLLTRIKDYLINQAEAPIDGDAVINNIDVGANETMIISATGKITIKGNIIGSGGSTVYNLPQVIIYAGNGIDIDGDVTRIDAWIITDGTINTCKINGNNPALNYVAAMTNDYPGYQYSQYCYKNLQINGPVFAKNVLLYRTYGADGIGNNDDDTSDERSKKPPESTDRSLSDDRAATAEVFNLSADTYLWAYAQAGRYGSSYTEAYSRELPPRY